MKINFQLLVFILVSTLISCGNDPYDKPQLKLPNSIEQDSSNADIRINGMFTYNESYNSYSSNKPVLDYHIAQKETSDIQYSLDTHTRLLRWAKSERSSGRYSGETARFTNFVYRTEDKVKSLNKIYDLFKFILDNGEEILDVDFELKRVVKKSNLHIEFAYLIGKNISGFKYIQPIIYLTENKSLFSVALDLNSRTKQVTFFNNLATRQTSQAQVLKQLQVTRGQRHNEIINSLLSAFENNYSLQDLKKRNPNSQSEAIQKYDLLFSTFKGLQ